MAITLSLILSDAEQAKVVGWLDTLLPGKTNAEKKAILEDHAKGLLRDDLVRRIRGARRQEVLDLEATINAATSGADIVADNPFGGG